MNQNLQSGGEFDTMNNEMEVEFVNEMTNLDEGEVSSEEES